MLQNHQTWRLWSLFGKTLSGAIFWKYKTPGGLPETRPWLPDSRSFFGFVFWNRCWKVWRSKIEACVLEDGDKNEGSETILWWSCFPRNPQIMQLNVLVLSQDHIPWNLEEICRNMICHLLGLSKSDIYILLLKMLGTGATWGFLHLFITSQTGRPNN